MNKLGGTKWSIVDKSPGFQQDIVFHHIYLYPQQKLFWYQTQQIFCTFKGIELLTSLLNNYQQSKEENYPSYEFLECQKGKDH